MPIEATGYDSQIQPEQSANCNFFYDFTTGLYTDRAGKLGPPVLQGPIITSPASGLVGMSAANGTYIPSDSPDPLHRFSIVDLTLETTDVSSVNLLSLFDRALNSQLHNFFGSTHTWAVGRYVFAVANTAALRYSAIASASGVVSGSSATDLGFTRVSTIESITLMAIASFTSMELNITNSRDIVTSTVQAWWGGNRACPAIFGK